MLLLRYIALLIWCMKGFPTMIKSIRSGGYLILIFREWMEWIADKKCDSMTPLGDAPKVSLQDA